MLRAFSVFIVTGLVASFAWAATLTGPAPGFTLQSRDGQQVSLASLKGKLLRKCRQATHDKICIMGGTRETDESWFVAVSREKLD